MLRRNPTRITLTTEDITLYEENRQREAMEQEALHREEQAQLAQQQEQQQTSSSPTQTRQGTSYNREDLKPASSDKSRILGTRSREERLGLGIAGAGTSRG